MFGSNSVKQFRIFLDNPQRSYFAGQVVSGKLILDLERERKTTGIKLNFVGKANVRWTESHTVTTGTGSQRRTRTETRTYSNSETYFDQKVYLLGSSGGPEMELPPGYREFPFSFQLPTGIPSSFQGSYGHIQYSLTATLKKSWGFDKTTTTVFTVNGFVDLNTFSGASSPSQFTKSKHLGCLCCKSGPISFIFHLNRFGFVPGERIDFILEMDNKSDTPIPRVDISLKRYISFHANGKSRSESVKVTGVSVPGVDAGETETVLGNSLQFQIPPIPPTNLGGCRIINVDYALHVEMEIPGGFNLKGSTKILIGTIPFRNNFENMRPTVPAAILVSPTQPGFPPVQPTAPQLEIPGYPDLPPPTYEESFPSGGLPTYGEATEAAGNDEGDNGKNKDGIQFDPNFIPKYATYGWNTPHLGN